MTDNSRRGLASADDDTRQQVSSMGGQSQGQDNNPGNFANDREKASKAGQKGAANQPRSAKAKGGQNSRGGGR
jgi:general stress protein YciG